MAFEFRTYDPRVSRFLSIDPMTATTPWETPYAFANNSSIQNIDYLGLFGDRKTARKYKRKHKIKGRIKRNSDGNFDIIKRKGAGFITDDLEFGIIVGASSTPLPKSNTQLAGFGGVNSGTIWGIDAALNHTRFKVTDGSYHPKAHRGRTSTKVLQILDKKGAAVKVNGNTLSGYKTTQPFSIDGPHKYFEYPHINTEAYNNKATGSVESRKINTKYNHQQISSKSFNRAKMIGAAAPILQKGLKPVGIVVDGLAMADAISQAGTIYDRKVGAEAASIAGGIAGGWAGAQAGTAIGASIGSIIPGAGTAIGGVLGGIIGGIYGGNKGSNVGRSLVED